ncbi:MAG TPA: sulfate ABC transporter permease subunit CysW [Candidatus Angelobacter sp.]|nr:sulfate ABC transporter permease subunit CysW [Candidatus Angelobacter sp.]
MLSSPTSPTPAFSAAIPARATNRALTESFGRVVQRDPLWMRIGLIGATLLFLLALVLLPLALVFIKALERGVHAFGAAISDPAALDAIRLTLFISISAVLVNLAFGLMAAWAITKFEFRGKSLIITLIDLPFSVSPVVSGLIFVLLFGAQGWFGPWLREHHFKIIFAWPGILLATIFVTSPFVARELIPLMQAQGSDEEQAALTLGASGWQIFWRVTFPNIRWGLAYALILCNARAMGEFGAVSVVSGHIRGRTNTLPLHVEVLYNEYASTAAFGTAALLALFALFTLGLKTWAEHHISGKRQTDSDFRSNE